ncbi:MAG TPA: ABC transporter permease [Thermomicrobiales bacterium]|nr:ABC transporter permease [Thermomicrobiales bacterium]
MQAFLIRRLLLAIPVLFVVSLVVFILTNWLPGDAALARFGEEGIDEQRYEALRAEMGLDRPAPVRYFQWVGDTLRGDFGNSTRNKQPVSELIATRFPVTLQLAVTSLIVALFISIPAGIISAMRPGSIIDRVVTVLAVAGVAMPSFWLAVLLILLFSLRLNWLPPSGWAYVTDSPLQAMKLLIMPSLVLGTASAASLMRHLRSSLGEELRQAYVTVAQAKGLANRRVVFRHALKNAMIPVITMIGLQIGHLLGGSVIVETMFGLPGLSRATVDAILSRDLPVLQATVLFAAVTVVVANLLTDVCYAWLNPRIRYS